MIIGPPVRETESKKYLNEHRDRETERQRGERGGDSEKGYRMVETLRETRRESDLKRDFQWQCEILKERLTVKTRDSE